MSAVPRAAVAPWLGRYAELPGAAYLFVLLAAGFAFAAPEFGSARNLSNIGLQAAALIIVALGMTLVILTEGIDLSLGPVLGLCGVVMACCWSLRHPLSMAIGAALLDRHAFGHLNGTLVA